jgi:hypothetical protein
MHLLLAVTAAQKHHLQEIGLVIAVVGALAVVLSGALGLRPRSRTAERSAMIVGGLLLAVGLGIQLFALHAK